MEWRYVQRWVTFQQFGVHRTVVRRPTSTRYNCKYTVPTMNHPEKVMVWGVFLQLQEAWFILFQRIKLMHSDTPGSPKPSFCLSFKFMVRKPSSRTQHLATQLSPWNPGYKRKVKTITLAWQLGWFKSQREFMGITEAKSCQTCTEEYATTYVLDKVHLASRHIAWPVPELDLFHATTYQSSSES